MLALQLACAQTSSVTLLVFMKQLKALTKAAIVCSAARMRPDPDLPAFSMEAPLRVAQALMQYLALLISALRQRHQEARMIQSVALSASKRRERSPQQDVQQQLTSKVVAAAIAQEVSCASHHEERGRPVPARLPLQLKLNEVNIKNLVGEFVAVAFSGIACIRHIGWAMVLALLSCTSSCKVSVEGLPPLLKLSELLRWKGTPYVRTHPKKRGPCFWACAERGIHLCKLALKGHFMCLECMQRHKSMSNFLRCSCCQLNR